jgi:hypothetical protein
MIALLFGASVSGYILAQLGLIYKARGLAFIVSRTKTDAVARLLEAPTNEIAVVQPDLAL